MLQLFDSFTKAVSIEAVSSTAVTVDSSSSLAIRIVGPSTAVYIGTVLYGLLQQPSYAPHLSLHLSPS